MLRGQRSRQAELGNWVVEIKGPSWEARKKFAEFRDRVGRVSAREISFPAKYVSVEISFIFTYSPILQALDDESANDARVTPGRLLLVLAQSRNQAPRRPGQGVIIVNRKDGCARISLAIQR